MTVTLTDVLAVARMCESYLSDIVNRANASTNPYICNSVALECDTALIAIEHLHNVIRHAQHAEAEAMLNAQEAEVFNFA